MNSGHVYVLFVAVSAGYSDTWKHMLQIFADKDAAENAASILRTENTSVYHDYLVETWRVI